MRERPGRLGAEHGTTLVVVTAATVLLFGFAALAIDVGYGMSERRRAQSTADASALAAGVEANLPGATAQALVDSALLFADMNAPAPILVADWLASCPDTVTPGEQLEHTANELGLFPATDCVSFDTTFTTLRVSLPQQVLDTIFGGVIGIDTFDVTAYAEVSMHLHGLSASPPFAVTAGVSGGQERCIRTSSSGAHVPPRFQGNDTGNDPPTNPPGPGDPTNPAHADPCDDVLYDPDSQFFGSLKAWRYADCKQPSGNPNIAAVIADGIDHILGSFGDYEPGIDPELFDGDDKCTQAFPNTLELQTGFTAQLLKLGLLSTTATTPRLARANFQTTHTFAGEGMDNIPLWAYIRSDIAANEEDDGTPPEVHPSCLRASQNSDGAGRPTGTYDYFDLKELMVECLANHGAAGPFPDRIFDEDILTSARFAWIPVLDETTLSKLKGKDVHINAFVPVFIHKLYQQGQKVGSPDPFCWAIHPNEKNVGWYMHEAGQETGACGLSNQNVDRVAAIIVPCGALPDSVCIDDTTSNTPGGHPVFRLELTR